MENRLDALIRRGTKGNQCYINESLDGPIDLFSLHDSDIEEIHFVDGTISQLENLPNSLKKIVINRNKLNEIPRLPNLVHLEANDNELTHVNLKDLSNLVSLYLNNNKINDIQNIPPSLKVLYISGNELRNLDLHGANSCTTVNCLNNMMLEQIISGKQFSDPYFKLEKDPHTRIIMMNGGAKSSIDVKSAVENYYKLKKQYEDNKTKLIEKIKSKDISKQKKIKEIRNAQFKCVNCGKEGGTIFKKDDNYLKAMCGNKTDPCKLNIKILSSMSLSENDIRETQAEVNAAKQNIIKLKMDTLFGYITEEESIKNFEKNVEIIKKNSVLEKTLSIYEMQNESKRVNLIKKKMDTVYAEMASIRELLNEYGTSKNKRLLKDIALKHQSINDILTVVRSMKYPIHEVVEETVYDRVDDDENFIDESKAPKITMNVLKQYTYSFDDLFNPNLDLLKVLKYEK
jgi:Leucine-rich repeat (LRR) protein